MVTEMVDTEHDFIHHIMMFPLLPSSSTRKQELGYLFLLFINSLLRQ